jgi:SPP1 gp7 family putative phage head morphogenesis protein
MKIFGWSLTRTDGKPEIHAEENRDLAAQPADPPTEQGKSTPAPSTTQTGWAVGTTLFQMGDFPRYNPDELQIRKGKDVYRRMMQDDQVKAVAEFKRDAVTSRKWFFDKKATETTSGDSGFDAQHEEIEDFFKAAIEQMEMPWKDALDAILTGMRNGFSICEKVYKTITWEDRPYWGIKQIVLLPFHTFDGGIIAKQGTSDVTEFRQMVGGRPVTKIPRDKCIYFVHRPDEDPLYGESDLKAAYRPWWSKDIAIKFQNIHLERHAGGFVTANVKDAAVLSDPKLKDDLKRTLQNISAMTAILAPVGVDIELVAPARTDAYDKAIQGYDKAIAKSMLVPNLLGLSEQGDTGSYSQSQTQLEVFFWVLDKIVERLEDALNRQLFAEIAMNNFGTDDFPRFKFEPLTESQKREIAKAWGELMKAGAVTHSKTDEAHTRKMLGYPELPKELADKIGQNPVVPAAGEATPGAQGGGGGADTNIDPATGKPKQPAAAPKKGEPGFVDPARETHSHVHADPNSSWMKRVDYKAIKSALDTVDAKFNGELANAMARAKKYIIEQIKAAGAEKTFGKLDPASVLDIGRMPRPLLGEIRTIIRQNLQRVLQENYDLAKQEMPKKARMAKEVRPGMDMLQADRYLSSKAMRITGVIDQDTLTAVQIILENAIKYDKNMADTIAALEDSTDLVALLPRYDAAGRAVNVPARIENIVRTNDADALNQGRMALFGEPEFRNYIQAFEYSAILDDRTTDECAALDGDIRQDWGSLTPPNHYQCRSILVPVTDDDNWDGKQDKIPSWVKPMKGFA